MNYCYVWKPFCLLMNVSIRNEYEFSYISSECLLKRMFSPWEKLQFHQSHASIALHSCQFWAAKFNDSLNLTWITTEPHNSTYLSNIQYRRVRQLASPTHRWIKIIQFVFTDIWPKRFWMHCKCVSVPTPNFHIWQLNAHFLLLCILMWCKQFGICETILWFGVYR